MESLNKALKALDVDVTNICVALCLCLVGYYYGALRGGSVSSDVFSLTTLIVSISALIIAKQALGTWRNQFKHQLQHRALVSAELCLRNYCSSEDDFRNECMKRRNEQGANFDSSNKHSEVRNSLKREYQRAWNELAISGLDFVEKNANLEPDKISKSYLKHILELHEEDFKVSRSDYYTTHQSNLEEGVRVFLTSRKKLG